MGHARGGIQRPAAAQYRLKPFLPKMCKRFIDGITLVSVTMLVLQTADGPNHYPEITGLYLARYPWLPR